MILNRLADGDNYLLTIPDGRAGVRATLKLMSEIATRYKVDPAMRELALTLVRNVPEKDFTAEVEAIHSFVRSHVRYVADVDGVETLQTPDVTLRVEQGDCDDQSILVATLLLASGHPARFKVVGFAPGELSHVFVETLIGRQWVSVETTEPVAVGWQPANVRNVMIETI